MAHLILKSLSKKTVKKVSVILTVVTLISLSLLVGTLWRVSKPEKAFSLMVPVSLADYNFGKQARKQWALPKELHEVSGLAVVDQATLISESRCSAPPRFRACRTVARARTRAPTGTMV